MSGSCGQSPQRRFEFALGLAQFARWPRRRAELGHIPWTAATNFCAAEIAAATAPPAARPGGAAIWSSFRAATTRPSQAVKRGRRARPAPLLAARRCRDPCSCATPAASSSSPSDDGGARVELVGALHAPLHVAAIIQLDGDAVRGAARAPGPAPAPRPPRPIGTIATGRGAAAVRRQHRQPLDAAGPADAGRRRPAQSAISPS